MPAVNDWLDALIASAADGRGAVKAPVRVATTASITLSGEQTIDGVAVVTGDHVIVKDQGTAAQNGIWTCSSGGWSRRADADGAGDLFAGATVYVASGTAHGKTWWSLTTTGTIAVGATSLTWEELITSTVSAVPSSRQVIAGAGLSGGGTLASDVTIDVDVIDDTMHGTRAGGTLHAAATSGTAGFMSAADKLKLDNGGDFGTLTTDVLDAGASGDLSVGDTAGSTTITAVTDVTLDVAGDAFLFADGASSWWGFGGSGVLETDGSSLDIDTPTVRWTTGTTSPTLTQAARTGDAATTSLTIASQAPYASATGTNRDASPVIIQVPAPAAGGAASYVRIDVDTTDNHRLMRNGVYIAKHTTSGGAWIGAYTDLAASGSAAMYLGSGAATRGATNYVVLAGASDASFNAPSAAGAWTARLGNTTHFYFSASGGVTTYRMSDAAADVLTFACDATGASTCTIGAGVTSYTITQTTRASDAATYDLIIQTQPANASASTDANRQPGELILRVNSPSNGGTLAAGVTTQWGTTTSAPTRREHAEIGVQTTDATVTTIGYLTLEEGSTHSMIVRVTGKVVATGVVLCEAFAVAAKRAGAGAVLEDAQRLSTAGAGGWTVAFDASGNDIRCRVTGAGGTTIEWDCHWDTFYRVRT